MFPSNLSFPHGDFLAHELRQPICTGNHARSFGLTSEHPEYHLTESTLVINIVGIFLRSVDAAAQSPADSSPYIFADIQAASSRVAISQSNRNSWAGWVYPHSVVGTLEVLAFQSPLKAPAIFQELVQLQSVDLQEPLGFAFFQCLPACSVQATYS